MRWKTRNPLGHFSLSESIEIGDSLDSVFAHWNSYEDFPAFMDSVRRTKRIHAARVLWDIDIAGHQIVWDAHIVEFVPDKLVRWESSWGAANSGEARFEAIDEGRTRVHVRIEFEPQGLLEHLGARLGLADLCVRRDLERFRDFLESRPRDQPESGRIDSIPRPSR